MDNIKNAIYDLFESFTLKKIVIVILIIAFFACLYAYGNHKDNMDIRDFEIINHSSFVGEVISKHEKQYRSSWGYIFSGTTYHMHITGEYLSSNNEVIFFDRKDVKVNEEFYNRFEKGDIISH